MKPTLTSNPIIQPKFMEAHRKQSRNVSELNSCNPISDLLRRILDSTGESTSVQKSEDIFRVAIVTYKYCGENYCCDIYLPECMKEKLNTPTFQGMLKKILHKNKSLFIVTCYCINNIMSPEARKKPELNTFIEFMKFLHAQFSSQMLSKIEELINMYIQCYKGTKLTTLRDAIENIKYSLINFIKSPRSYISAVNMERFDLNDLYDKFIEENKYKMPEFEEKMEEFNYHYIYEFIPEPDVLSCLLCL